MDQVFDLDVYPRPFASNQIDEYFCDNILEHLDYDKTIREIHRTLKK
ncbi:MAG: methyltransferase domain-containing protein [bacterium]